MDTAQGDRKEKEKNDTGMAQPCRYKVTAKRKKKHHKAFL
jgi:hypothetical protein